MLHPWLPPGHLLPLTHMKTSRPMYLHHIYHPFPHKPLIPTNLSRSHTLPSHLLSSHFIHSPLPHLWSSHTARILHLPLLQAAHPRHCKDQTSANAPPRVPGVLLFPFPSEVSVYHPLLHAMLPFPLTNPHITRWLSAHLQP